MKILVLGDVHGRFEAMDIIVREGADKTVFLGDLVSSHDGISASQQMALMEDILNLADDDPNRWIVLRGNHDTQHAGYAWAECSGYNPRVAKDFPTAFWLANTKWLHTEDFGDTTIVFSHAGISKTWMRAAVKMLSRDKSEDEITKLTLNDINELPPCELFGFTPNSPLDRYGNSPTQPLTWIRPSSLANDALESEDRKLIQVVGHTPVKSIVNLADIQKNLPDIWLCDNLPNQYLVIEDGVFNVKNF